jgi:hypothetical protein
MSMRVAVMVFVVAMLIVNVMVMMIVRGVVVDAVIMWRMSVRGTRRLMPMPDGIGTAFGVERRLDLDDARTQSFHHFLDDVVAPDPQAFAHDLRRQMAIAEMPCEANQMERVAAADFEQRLRRGHDFDQTPVFENQRVAPTQCNRGFEVEQKLKSARACHHHPPPMAIVEIEHHRIGRRLRPTVLSLDLRRPDHCEILTLIGHRLFRA